jgi:hypothetical protein
VTEVLDLPRLVLLGLARFLFIPLFGIVTPFTYTVAVLLIIGLGVKLFVVLPLVTGNLCAPIVSMAGFASRL